MEPLRVCHNGNLINAGSLRENLEHQGAIFQSTTDTEVILHLLARSQQTGILDGLAESLSQVQGAFSLLILTKDAMIGVRDPYGFRPLCLGKLNGSHVLASESCAFDLIDAQYIREIEPGEIVMIRGEQITSVKALHAPRTGEVRLRARLFLPARQHGVRPHRPEQPRQDGPGSGAEKIPSMRIWSFRFRTPAWLRPSATPRNPAFRLRWD